MVDRQREWVEYFTRLALRERGRGNRAAAHVIIILGQVWRHKGHERNVMNLAGYQPLRCSARCKRCQMDAIIQQERREGNG